MSDFISGYGYRKLHTINGTTDAGSNYQVKLFIYNTNGSNSGNTVYLNGKSTVFPYDVIFTSSNGTTLLPFWREDVNTFWVKVEDDLTSNQSIYVYYGNASATDTSSGHNTFTLFDDFEDYYVVSNVKHSEHPILHNGKLYIPSDGLYIRTATTGEELHHYLSGTQGDMSPVIDNTGKIHLAAQAGSWLKRINEATGVEETATYTIPDYEALTYDSVNNAIIIQTTDGLKSIDAGAYTTVNWTNTDVTFTAAMCGSSLIVGNYVYAQSNVTGVVVNVNLVTGVTAANTTLDAVNAGYSPLIYDIDHDYLYAFAYASGKVYCLDASTLATIWTKVPNTGDYIIRSAYYHSNILYIPTRHSTSPYGAKVFALDVLNSGNILWTNTTAYDANADVTNGILTDNHLFLPTYDYLDGNYMKLIVINISDGTLNTTYAQAGNSACSSIVASGGAIYMGMYDTYYTQKIQVTRDGVATDFPYKADAYHTGYHGTVLSGSFLPDNYPKWTNTGAWNIYGGGYIWKTDTSSGVNKVFTSVDTTFARPLAIETRCKVGTDYAITDHGWLWDVIWDVGWFTNEGFFGGEENVAGTEKSCIYYTQPPYDTQTTDGAIIANTWYRNTLRITNTAQYYDRNGVQKCTISKSPTQTTNPINISMVANADSSAFTSYVDFVFVRKYVYPEPTHGAWGDEEVPTILTTPTMVTHPNSIYIRQQILGTHKNYKPNQPTEKPRRKVWI